MTWFQVCYEVLTPLSLREEGGAPCSWRGHSWPSASPESKGTVPTALLRSTACPGTPMLTGRCRRHYCPSGEAVHAAGGGICIPDVQGTAGCRWASSKLGRGNWWAKLLVSAPQVLSLWVSETSFHWGLMCPFTGIQATYGVTALTMNTHFTN